MIRSKGPFTPAIYYGIAIVIIIRFIIISVPTFEIVIVIAIGIAIWKFRV